MLSTTNTTDSPEAQSTCNLDEALKYSQMGLRVFPLQPGTKIPMTAHGVKDATDDPLVIKEWWTKTPDAGIGLAARAEQVGDPCFLEFDQRPWLAAWAKELGQEKPVTRLHKSGGKESPHYIFRHTEKSLALGNCDGAKDGHEWFSFRAANRYIVAPPSIHPDSGKPYTVELDIEPVSIPDWLVVAIAAKGIRDREFANDMPELHEDFDFDAFCDWIPAKLGDEDGSWYAFEECPVAGRRHKGQGVRGCALYYDGGKLGFKCMAAECPSNADRKPGQGGIGYLLSFLSQEHGAYPGVIWPQQTTEDLLEEFGAEEMAEDENVIAPAERSEAPAAQVLGEAADPSEARGGDIGLLPKRSKLNAKQKDILAKKQKQQQTCEENWGGLCRGGCGKYNQGEYYCVDCKKTQQDKSFALRPGEVELYRGNIGKKEDKIVRQVIAIEATSLKPERMTWLWQERIPDGAITWVVGQPGNAKSLFTIEVVACATTGRDYPDGAKNTTGPVKVLMFCGEDDLKKTVIPRLLAAGANLKNIRFLDSRSFRGMVGDIVERGRAIDLDQDMETLMGVLKANPDIRLMVADPITGIFGAKQITKDQEVNPILEELVDLCKETGLVFLGVCHTPKRQTNSATEKIAGGSSVAGKCRAAFMLSHDPDSDGKHDHVMTMIKGNLTGVKSGLKYKTVEHDLGEGIRIAKIEWGEPTDDMADDILAKQNSKTVERDRQEDKCEAFLKTFLAKEPQRSPEVYDAAKQLGFGASTVKRALKSIGGHHIDRRAQGQGYWMSLTPAPASSTPAEDAVMSVGAGEGL
jgi:putative DNA primase/helicase